MKLLEKIIVPVNLDSDSNPQIEAALELARKFNSHIICLNVLPEEAKNESINPLLIKHIDQNYDQIVKNIKDENISIEKRIEYGNRFEKILSIAEDENANLILFSNNIDHTKEENYAVDILAEKLIRKSQKPVWIVKEDMKYFPEKILCSIDYSDASTRALNNAIKISRTFNKELHIINILEPIVNSYSPRYTIDLKQENERKSFENQKVFNKYLSGFNFIDVNYQSNIIIGDTEKEIKRYIVDNQIDLLFMGATGKTFFQRILLGSVTEKIIREFPCSMVITKSENILNLKIDSDITEIEKHISIAQKLEKTGYYDEAIEQLLICLQKNDLHIPTLSLLSQLYQKTGNTELANTYKQKIDSILKRLWNEDIEKEIRKHLKF